VIDYKNPDVAAAFADLQRRVQAIEVVLATLRYSSATLPAPSLMQGAVIFNTTTNVHQGSDGTTWNNLY
jgi:hypothetical protein